MWRTEGSLRLVMINRNRADCDMKLSVIGNFRLWHNRSTTAMFMYTAAVGHEVPVVFVIICREAGTYPCSIRVNLEPSQGVDTTVPFNKVTGRESNLKHYSLGFKTFSQNLSIFTIVKFSMAFKGHSSDLVTIALWLWQQFDRLETSVQTRVPQQSSLHSVTVSTVDFAIQMGDIAVETADVSVWMVHVAVRTIGTSFRTVHVAVRTDSNGCTNGFQWSFKRFVEKANVLCSRSNGMFSRSKLSRLIIDSFSIIGNPLIVKA